MDPVLVEIYSNSLSQEDIDGISAFYRSPAGKSYVNKLPVIMQQSTNALQKVTTAMM